MKISIIVPTYNEKENIEVLIKALYKNCAKSLKEIIIVDDNSPDGTHFIVQDLSKKFKNLRLILRKGKKGLPSAISEGIKNAKGEYVLWMDSDLSHPPPLILEMLKFIPKYDVVCASRYVKGGKDNRPFPRILTSRMLNTFGNIILRTGVKDMTSGFCLVRKSVFDKLELKQEGYVEYCIRFTYQSVKNGYKWKEVPYISNDRKKGSSKSYMNFFNFIKNGYLCIKEIIQLRFS